MGMKMKQQIILLCLLAFYNGSLLLAQDPSWNKSQFDAFIDTTEALIDEEGLQAGINEYHRAIQNGMDAQPDFYFVLLQKLAHYYNRSNKIDSTLYYLDIAKELIEKENLTHYLHRYYLNKGNYYFGQLEYQTALEHYQQGIAYAKQYKISPEPIANLYSMLSPSYKALGNRDSALIIAQKALEIYKAENAKDGIPKIMNDIGLIYYRENNYGKALLQFIESYNYAKKNKAPRRLIYSTTYIGHTYHKMNLLEEARRYYKEALILATRLGEERNAYHVQSKLADVNLSLGKIAIADSLISDLGNKPGSNSLDYCYYQSLSGHLNLAKGKLDLAEKEYESIAGSCANYFNHPELKSVYLGLAKIKFERGEYNSALTYIVDSLKTINFNPAGRIEVAQLKSETYAALNNYKAAHVALKEKLAWQDTLKNNQTLGVTFTAQTELELKDKQNEIEKLKIENNVIALRNQRRNILIGFLTFAIIGIGVLGYLLSRHNKIKLEKDLVNVKQQLLRIQINPHFIFNILNSIQHSFLQNDEEKTIHLFSKFSSLMRQVLDNSNNSFIPLNEELEMLINYLELEKTRTNNKFDFSINIGEDVDIYMEEIPSMVLQIFVENSIWHGISPKSTKGMIKINVSKENGKLIIAVEDNGVGRSFSLKHKSKDQKNKKSLGSRLAQERIGLLNRKFGKNLKLKISDGKQNIGTKVELAI